MDNLSENSSPNLRDQTVDGLLWSFAESVLGRGTQFISGVILARLLFPEQFGLIGMLLIFIAVARVFVEGGFSSALIQKVDITEADICSIFYFNVLIGFALTGVLCMIAPWIAAFFNQPILTPLMRLISITIAINSFGTVHETLFSRDINFKAHTMTSLIAGSLSAIVGISLAIEGFGIWSLAFQQISLSVFRTATLWVLSPWRPSAEFSLGALREMFGFGSRILFSSVLDQIFQNIYLPVIGKFFSAADLGLFTRARMMQALPSQTLAEVFGRITFPVFSRRQTDRDLLKKGMKKALTALALLNFPLMAGICVTARPLVLVLLGPKWSGCIPYLQLLCAIGLLYPLQALNLNMLKSLGRSDLFMRLEIIKKILIILNIAITWRWGICAIIYGMIAISLISFYLNTYYIRDLIDYPTVEQVRDLLPYLTAAGLTGAAALSLKVLEFPSHLVLLLAQMMVGATVYFALCWVLKLSAFVEIRREIRTRLPLWTTLPSQQFLKERLK